jgi:hypothetical protein
MCNESIDNGEYGIDKGYLVVINVEGGLRKDMLEFVEEDS